MIPVRRTPPPRVLVRNGDRWLRELRAALTGPGTSAQVEWARNKYRRPAIKDALVRMFYGKCAYCESKLTHIAYGAIEHFRPKARYVDRTFDWDNLLLSCDICNDAGHKGAHFPLDGHGAPLLIDPTTSVPSLHLRFDWDPVARSANVYGTDVRGREVERVFDLNGTRGRKELIRQRSNYIEKLLVLRDFAAKGDKRAQTLLDDACRPSAEYNAFAHNPICP